MKGGSFNIGGRQQHVTKFAILHEEEEDYLNSKTDSNSQEIWEDLIVNLLGLNSEYNHLLPTEDQNKSDLLTPAIPNESISPPENQAPSIENSFQSNPIASPSSDHIVLTVLHNESMRDRKIEGCFGRAASRWGFVITNLIMETLSAACDQLSSPRKPLYALIGFLISLSTLFICVGELIYKSRKELSSRTQAGRFYKAIFSSFVETLGFICAVSQCIFSTVQYIYFKQHENNPIQLNIFPVVFAACLALSMACRKPDIETGHTD